MYRENTTRYVFREVSYLRLLIKFVDGFRFWLKYGRNISLELGALFSVSYDLRRKKRLSMEKCLYE